MISISHNELNKFMWQSLKENYNTGDTGDAKLGIWTKKNEKKTKYIFSCSLNLRNITEINQVIIQRSIRNNILNALRKLLR